MEHIRATVEEFVEETAVVSDEEAEQLELDFDFTPEYNNIAIQDTKRALAALVKEAIRLRASRSTVNKMLKHLADDNDILPVVIKQLLPNGGQSDE